MIAFRRIEIIEPTEQELSTLGTGFVPVRKVTRDELRREFGSNENSAPDDTEAA